jgi:hypothetical protein
MRIKLLLLVWVIVLSGCWVSLEEPEPEALPDYYTEINQSETIEGVTVDVRWAYVTDQQGVIGLSVTLEDSEGNPQFINVRRTPNLSLRFLEENGLAVVNGYQISTGSYNEEIALEFYFTKNIELPNRLNFTLELAFNEIPTAASRPLTPIDYFESTVTFLQVIGKNPPERVAQLLELAARLLPGVTGGGYAGAISGVFGSEESMTVPEDGVGVFTFDFSLPVNRADTVEPNITVTSQNIPITLERVTVSPTEVEALACMTLAPDARAWQLEARLVAEGVDPRWIGNSTRYYVEDDPRRCYILLIPLREPLVANPFTIQITSIEDFDVKYEDWLKIQRLVEDDGITIDLSDGVSIQYPTGFFEIPDPKPLNDAKVETGYRIEGDWSFEVTLP